MTAMMEGTAQLLADGFAGSPLLGASPSPCRVEHRLGGPLGLPPVRKSRAAVRDGDRAAGPVVRRSMDGLHNADDCFSPRRAIGSHYMSELLQEHQKLVLFTQVLPICIKLLGNCESLDSLPRRRPVYHYWPREEKGSMRVSITKVEKELAYHACCLVR
ncbi:hypothetical protein CFC21_035156 [Triticum aestivum]|uniref:Uncharacterized protein n=2 Tax=Triticum aestivum TaxID=4565 RepID=A0A9R1F5H6_WHEAT|nr:hypothetical protein CFC21_035156 [Triticum aestivum]